MSAHGILMKSRMKLRTDWSFAGDTMVYMQPVPEEGYGTMGVDKESHLYYDPDVVENEWSWANVCAVLLHEVLHLIMLHPFRMPEEIVKVSERGMMTAEIMMKKQAYGWAADIKVNYMYHSMGLAKDLPGDPLLPDATGKFHTELEVGDKKYALTIVDTHKKSMERVYTEVLEFFKRIKKDQGQGSGSGGSAVSDAAGQKGSDDHGSWVKEGEDPSKTAEAAGDWLVRAAGALQAAQRSKGNAPNGLIEILEQLLEPKIDWRGKLQQFIQPIVAAGYSYRRPRRTSWVLGTILPGQDREGVSIIAHVDTSGSMSKRELEQILSELYAMLDAYPYVHITLLHSDAGDPQVIILRETDRDDILKKVRFKGRGGTSHKPVVKWVLDHTDDEGMGALICFTDGESDIQRCFDDLSGVIPRMLVLTRKEQVDELAMYCEDTAYLPCGA